MFNTVFQEQGRRPGNRGSIPGMVIDYLYFPVPWPTLTLNWKKYGGSFPQEIKCPVVNVATCFHWSRD